MKGLKCIGDVADSEDVLVQMSRTLWLLLEEKLPEEPSEEVAGDAFSAPDLSPCPCCGGKAVCCIVSGGGHPGRVKACCLSCGMMVSCGPVHLGTDPGRQAQLAAALCEVAASWNRRASAHGDPPHKAPMSSKA